MGQNKPALLQLQGGALSVRLHLLLEPALKVKRQGESRGGKVKEFVQEQQSYAMVQCHHLSRSLFVQCDKLSY